MLILPVPEDFYKLLQDGRLAAIASLCKSGRVVVVAIDIALVLIVAVLGAKDCRTDGTSKVLNVVFAIESSDIRAAKGATAVIAKEIESSKVVSLTQRVLVWRLIWNREEFGGDNLVAVLLACQFAMMYNIPLWP